MAPRDVQAQRSAAARINEKITVIGLGYVGLPVAVGFAAHCDHVTGFDLSTRRLDELRTGHDRTGEVNASTLSASGIRFTDDPDALAGTTMFIVTVPTPVTDAKRPDFSALLSACATIGSSLVKGAVVCFESTVYPGATEEICGPALEKASGLKVGTDFTLGYSPERINPGDKEHRLETIIKVVAGSDKETLSRLAAAYGSIITAGLHLAPSIMVAEAAKVIENTQRDVNIALMNELALIFDKVGIPTRDVLAAARTKWNFLGFTPGLVGGHCIGVDPYYLTERAEQVGHYPEVILSGRRINDSIGRFIGQKLIKLMAASGVSLSEARVGVMGLTFKENVPDLRNSRVPDIVEELLSFGITPLVHDPLCSAEECQHEFAIELSDLSAFSDLDGLIFAVPHEAYLEEGKLDLGMLKPGGALIDVRSVLDRDTLPETITYWSL